MLLNSFPLLSSNTVGSWSILVPDSFLLTRNLNQEFGKELSSIVFFINRKQPKCFYNRRKIVRFTGLGTEGEKQEIVGDILFD